MRYVAPARGSVDPAVFQRPPLAAWSEYADLLCGPDWPDVARLDALLPPQQRERFVAQTRAVLDDGLHYEQRIHAQGAIATRAANWHDLFNALAWLRYPAIKRALNAQQVAGVAQMGPSTRSRPQYALTHFDEAGVLVAVRDPSLLALWDAHDWHGLFWRRREAWLDGSIHAEVFGHALLEHALTDGKLLVGKALVFACGEQGEAALAQRCAAGIADGTLLRDPLELRPLPLSGIPGWHPDNGSEVFHRRAECYQPLRHGRRYPPPVSAVTSPLS
ncbi:DUF3025 domain-containing protein [Dyella sp. LX-66]|uniref:DUF3025 domain-containing protein n=1 Tax=unclassified Dyella TaxID=2634549 RepID=UPI001BE0CBC7|nr:MULTISPECIES: DUF3025 domain-containing protein [unclassified Dyella]MBT2118221.1 DUF3025 domain-containing protein [Dyella sp. LX-1]MBT2138753.1 DUF3025 domain-containing protein [Dyella sp. LX-66]